jgi:hypothetical protein
MAEGLTAPMAAVLRQRTAPTCLAIRVVTGLVLLATTGLLVASIFSIRFLPLAVLMSCIDLVCFLTAPVAYELDRGVLTIVMRAGRRSFGPVVACSRVESKPSLTLRLWGNGGVFAGTGIYWNRTWGVFRAYVTAGSYADYVLVQTQDKKVLISPEDPAAFVEACRSISL